METQTDTQTDTIESLHKVKRVLEFRTTYNPADYSKEWAALAARYAAIDARANAAYCASHAKKYQTQIQHTETHAWEWTNQ